MAQVGCCNCVAFRRRSHLGRRTLVGGAPGDRGTPGEDFLAPPFKCTDALAGDLPLLLVVAMRPDEP